MPRGYITCPICQGNGYYEVEADDPVGMPELAIPAQLD